MPRELKDMEELVEAILIRLPPDEPEHLVRASLVCKSWCSLLSDHGFRSRYRVFHKTPPILGFFHNLKIDPPFVSTTKFLPRAPRGDNRRYVEDCRHGRVLLSYKAKDEELGYLVVWDPMTGNTKKLRPPQRSKYSRVGGTVLCAVDGCDHGACHLGPFFVVFLHIDQDQDEGVATAYVYSSQTSTWSSPASLDLGPVEDQIYFSSMSTLLTGDALHVIFWRDYTMDILKYDLGTFCLSEVEPPEIGIDMDDDNSPVLIALEEDDGWLGIAHLDDSELNLYLWWRELGPDQTAAWTQPTVIELQNLLHIPEPEVPCQLVGSIEGTAILFVITDRGTYKIDFKLLSSEKLKLMSEFPILSDDACGLYPYCSFYNPPVAQIEKLADSGDSETGSSTEESGESEAGSSDEKSGDSADGSSDEESGKSEAGSSDEKSGDSADGSSNEEGESIAGSNDEGSGESEA